MRISGVLSGAILVAASSAGASDLGNMTCLGSDPNWVLELLENQAQFRFAESTIDFDIPQIVMAEGDKGPSAITLLGQTETAIVLLEEELCRNGEEEHSHEVQVLTQRRGLPILLSGCCSVIE